MKAKDMNEDLSYLAYNIELIVVWFSFIWAMNKKAYDVSKKSIQILVSWPASCDHAWTAPCIDSKKQHNKSVPENM